MEEKMEVITSAGIIRAYKNSDPGQPGITIMFQPFGYDYEIDMSCVSVYENKEYRTEENEREVDAVIYTYGDCHTEDYTHKDIIRREDIVKALKG